MLLDFKPSLNSGCPSWFICKDRSKTLIKLHAVKQDGKGNLQVSEACNLTLA